jgi:hypothetical protein
MAAQHRHQAKPAFNERFQNYAAFFGACGLIFFVHPFVYSASVSFVTDFGEQHYGLGWALPPLWWIGTFVAMTATSAVILKGLFAGSMLTLIRRFT